MSAKVKLKALEPSGFPQMRQHFKFLPLNFREWHCLFISAKENKTHPSSALNLMLNKTLMLPPTPYRKHQG